MKNHRNFYITYGILSVIATLISIFLFSTPEALSLITALDITASDTINFIDLQTKRLFLSICTVVAMIIMIIVSQIAFAIARKTAPTTLVINRKAALLPALGIWCCMLFLGCLLTHLIFFVGQAVIHFPIFLIGFKKRSSILH